MLLVSTVLFRRSDRVVASWSNTSREPSSCTIQPPRNQKPRREAATSRSSDRCPASSHQSSSSSQHTTSPRARSSPARRASTCPLPGERRPWMRASPTPIAASAPSPSPSSTTIASQSGESCASKPPSARTSAVGRLRVGTTTEANVRAAAVTPVACAFMEKRAARAADIDNVIELGHAHVREREIDPKDWRRFESYVAEILGALGMNLDTPGTRETPNRFLQALYDATAGYEGDPKLLTAFPA